MGLVPPLLTTASMGDLEVPAKFAVVPLHLLRCAAWSGTV